MPLEGGAWAHQLSSLYSRRIIGSAPAPRRAFACPSRRAGGVLLQIALAASDFDAAGSGLLELSLLAAARPALSDMYPPYTGPVLTRRAFCAAAALLHRSASRPVACRYAVAFAQTAARSP